jgi:hypothetical protein
MPAWRRGVAAVAGAQLEHRTACRQSGEEAGQLWRWTPGVLHIGGGIVGVEFERFGIGHGFLQQKGPGSLPGLNSFG